MASTSPERRKLTPDWKIWGPGPLTSCESSPSHDGTGPAMCQPLQLTGTSSGAWITSLDCSPVSLPNSWSVYANGWSSTTVTQGNTQWHLNLHPFHQSCYIIILLTVRASTKGRNLASVPVRKFFKPVFIRAHFVGSPKKKGLNQNVARTKYGARIWIWQVKKKFDRSGSEYLENQT